MISILSEIGKLFPDLKNPVVQSDIRKFLAALVCVFITGYAVYSASTNPKGLSSQFYIYTIVIILPIIVGILILNPVFKGPLTLKSLYFAGGVGLVICISIYMFYRVLNPASVSVATNILVFLLVFAVIIGLAIVYRLFARVVANMPGSAGFLLRALFLIPCLLLDLLESLFVELKNTPKMIVVLFVLEILVILAYLYVLPLVKKPANLEAINLLDSPTFLTQKMQIGTAKQFISTPDNTNKMITDGSGNQLMPIHYSISMWVYINPQPNSYSSKYPTEIFRYGVPVGNTGHPKIVYDNNSPSASDQCVIYTSQQDVSGTAISIVSQSWNQIVISYTDNSVDIFVNGELVGSSPYSKASLSFSDVFETGYGDNTPSGSGVYGAICNITYYKRPLNAFEIAAAYNLNRYRNPPKYN